MRQSGRAIVERPAFVQICYVNRSAEKGTVLAGASARALVANGRLSTRWIVDSEPVLLRPRGNKNDSECWFPYEEYCTANAHDGDRTFSNFRRVPWFAPTSSACRPMRLPLGRLCMTRGYFHWDAGESPKLILQNGGSRELEVGHYAPLLAAALDTHRAAEDGSEGFNGAFLAERPAVQELHPSRFLTHCPMDSLCADTLHRPTYKDKLDPAPEGDVAAGRFGGLMIQDKATIWINCFQKVTRIATDCIASFQQIVGPNEQVRRLYSDGAHETDRFSKARERPSYSRLCLASGGLGRRDATASCETPTTISNPSRSHHMRRGTAP